MNKKMNGKIKNAGTEILPRLRRITILLTLLLISEIFLFTATYRYLNRSIQNERIDSIEQMSTLISEKLLLLRQNYEDRIRQAALVIKSNQLQSLEQGRKLLGDYNQLYLLAEDGTCTSLQGEKIVLSESQEVKKLKTTDEIRTDFCTVQTKGDFWVFMAPLRDITISHKAYFGIIMLVDSNTYAEVAATALYENQGASYVVDQQGVIQLRPTKSTANDYLGGYNLLHTLQEKGVDEQLILKLQRGLKERQEVEFIADLGGETWRIQSFPDS